MSTESELKTAADEIDKYAEDCHCESDIADFVVLTFRPLMEKRESEAFKAGIRASAKHCEWLHRNWISNWNSEKFASNLRDIADDFFGTLDTLIVEWKDAGVEK